MGYGFILTVYNRHYRLKKKKKLYKSIVTVRNRQYTLLKKFMGLLWRFITDTICLLFIKKKNYGLKCFE